jgi:1-aminocyclopropane-1-carboxylate deaminase/D-cysteine desulfhydrase-like pyridoxal-dependent ACC family enzyme
VGARIFGYTGKILGISIDEQERALRERVAILATQTAEFIGEEIIFSAEDVLVNANYLAGGYGVLGDGEIEAVRLFAQTEGILLDPVYTGRAAAGMIDLLRTGYFHKDGNPRPTILFWHTGGTPALFATQYAAVAPSTG